MSVGTKTTPHQQLGGTATTRQRDRMHRVLVALAGKPALLEAWLRAGEIRAARRSGRKKVK